MDTLTMTDSPEVLGIVTGLFLLSELLALVPQIKANSVFQLISGALAVLVKKKAAPIIAVMCLLSFAACKTGDGKKFSERMVKVRGDAQKVLIEGCDALPGITIATDTIRELLPVNQRIEDGIEVGQDLAAKICARVQARKGGS